MKTKDELLKEMFQAYTDVVNILVADKLSLVKQYVALENEYKEAMKDTGGKPSLFGNPPPPVEKPPVNPPAGPVKDPLSNQGFKSKEFPDGDPRSPNYEKSVETAKEEDLPWNKGIPQEGLKKPVITYTDRPKPSNPLNSRPF